MKKKIAQIVGGTAAWGLLGVSAALAQTGTSTTGTTTVPGVPNTGAGDVFTNILLLGISAAVVAVGIVYLARARANATE